MKVILDIHNDLLEVLSRQAKRLGRSRKKHIEMLLESNVEYFELVNQGVFEGINKHGEVSKKEAALKKEEAVSKEVEPDKRELTSFEIMRNKKMSGK